MKQRIGMFWVIVLCGITLPPIYGMEKTLDDSVQYNESMPSYTLIGKVMGLSKGREPTEAPEQSVLKYEDEEVMELPGEKMLMRVLEGQDGREKVKNTTKYPFSCFTHINIVFSHNRYGGSGVLIGPHHVLTAAHCVYDFERGTWADTCLLYCGLNGSAAPFDYCRGVRFYVPEEYVKDKDKNFDVGLIVLDKPIGLKIGYLGCLFANDSSMFEEKLNITGYPGDKGFKEMWSMSHSVKKVQGERIYYDIDTYGGQSGSPIWSHFTLNSDGELTSRLWPLVVGIHTHGEGLENEGNSGIRLTEQKFRLIMQWIGQTGVLVDRLTHIPGSAAVSKAGTALSVVCTKAPDGQTSLRGAAVAKAKEIETLLANGANFYDREITKLLLTEGDDLISLEKDGWTALHLAARDGLKEVVEVLLTHGANTEAREHSTSLTPLYFAAEKGHRGVVELLVAKRADINARNTKGDSPLYVAILNGHKDLVEFLIAKWVNLKALAGDGRTYLHRAAMNGHKKVAEFLIAKGVDVRAKDVHGYTPLFLAVANGHKELVQLLIAKKSDVNAVAKSSSTPLHLAAENGYREVVELLVASGAHVRAEGAEGWTPLHTAGYDGYEEIATFLIAHGAEINARTKKGATPLLLAAEQDHEEVVQFLIAHGADVNAADVDGYTPLHRASVNGHRKVVELLIANGAEINARTKKGSAPLHEAAGKGLEEMVQLLIANGAEVNAKNNANGTPLHFASFHGQGGVVELLIANGADVNARNKRDMTALHLAAQEGHVEVVKLLVAKGAYPALPAYRNYTPLTLAQQKGHKEIVEFLRGRRNNW